MFGMPKKPVLEAWWLRVFMIQTDTACAQNGLDNCIWQCRILMDKMCPPPPPPPPPNKPTIDIRWLRGFGMNDMQSIVCKWYALPTYYVFRWSEIDFCWNAIDYRLTLFVNTAAKPCCYASFAIKQEFYAMPHVPRTWYDMLKLSLLITQPCEIIINGWIEMAKDIIGIFPLLCVSIVALIKLIVADSKYTEVLNYCVGINPVHFTS